MIIIIIYALVTRRSVMLARTGKWLCLAAIGVLLAACSGEGSTDAGTDQALAPVAGATRDARPAAVTSEPVVVYSSRQEHLIKPVFDRFTAETGIPVQYQTGEEGPL